MTAPTVANAILHQRRLRAERIAAGLEPDRRRANARASWLTRLLRYWRGA